MTENSWRTVRIDFMDYIDYRSVGSLSSEETCRKKGTDIYSHWPEQGAGQACSFLGDGYRAQWLL